VARRWRLSCSVTATPAAAPLASILDNFNRADEGRPRSAPWVNFSSSGLKVVSNQAASAGGTGDNSSYWSTAFSADQECFVSAPTAMAFEVQRSLHTQCRSERTPRVIFELTADEHRVTGRIFQISVVQVRVGEYIHAHDDFRADQREC
jgi:hypothetical protein